MKSPNLRGQAELRHQEDEAWFNLLEASKSVDSQVKVMFMSAFFLIL